MSIFRCSVAGEVENTWNFTELNKEAGTMVFNFFGCDILALSIND